MFEDHGQTLVPGSQQNKGSSRIQKFKPARPTEKSKVVPPTRSMTTTKLDRTQEKADIELYDSQSPSEDEMDLLSHRNRDDHDTSQKRVSHSQDNENDGFRDGVGEWHRYIDGFKPKAHVFSTLKFNKNKAFDKAPRSSSDTAFSQPISSQPPPSPSKDANARGSSSKSKCDASTAPGDTIHVRHRPLSSKDPNSKSEGRPSSVRPAREKLPLEPNRVLEGMKFGPPSRSAHPRIKRLNPEGGKRQSNDSSTTKRHPSSVSAFDNLLESECRRNPKTRSRSRSRSRCPSPKVTVRKPEEFPLLSPPASPLLPKRQPEQFPHLSPVADSKKADHLPRRQKRQANPFPMLSPPSKQEATEQSRGRTGFKRIKVKGQTKENKDAFMEPDDDDDDDDDANQAIMVSTSARNNGKGKSRALHADGAKEKTGRIPQRFPMSTKMLETIDSSPTTMSSRWGKRSSEGSGDEHISKRSKKERTTFPHSPTRAFEEEGDSLLFCPEVDPRSLCPYCDTLLPENPSSLLLDLIAATKKKANPDPRPSNPLGLKAPVAVFVTVCQRHRFESQILPEAEKKGWPKTIEWNKVASRVVKMKTVLQALIEDPGDSNTRDDGRSEEVEDEWEIPNCNKEILKSKGPKANSIFWNEVIQEIKEKGSRVVAGVRGQFANFERAQPGYYGEQGSVIIHQTLYDMFPPGSMDASLIAPLTGNEFKEKILVPEVALRLIMEDRNLKGEKGKQEALTVLRESSSYGVFMFPEDGGEWGGQRRRAKDNQLGVGDMIVMQRAMKRRKELEEEEGKAEEERRMQWEQECEERQERMNKSNKPAPTQPKPRPLGKGSSMSIASSQANFSRPTKQSRSDWEDTDPVSGIETAIELTESDSDGGQDERCPSTDEMMPRSSMSSTSRAVSGLNLSSDTDISSRAVVGAPPMTRSRSRSAVRKVKSRSSKTEVHRGFEDATKTPMPAGDDTPKPHPPLQNGTPPLTRARQRHNKGPVALPRPPLPTRTHLPASSSQDSRWLLDEDELL